MQTGGSWFLLGPPTGGLVDWFQHMTLPAVAMALGLVGIYARYVRSAMVTALREPHVIVARAKGLPEHTVTTRHALRTSLVPFVAILSLELGGVVGASIVADGVFRTGGLATAFLQSLGNADPFLLTALLVATAVIVCGFMLLGDVVIAMLDPRIRLAKA